MGQSTDKEVSDAFERLNIVNEELNRKKNDCSKFNSFMPKITAATDHISHKHSYNVSSREFVKNSTASNIDDGIVKDVISHILKQTLVVNKESQSDKGSCRSVTTKNISSIPDDPRTLRRH